MEWIGIIIGAIVSLMSIGVSARTAADNREAQKKALDQQAEENEKAFQRNLEMQREENEYNLPINQMARYQDAGLNPNLIYNSSNYSVSSPKATPNQVAPVSTDLSGVSSALNSISSLVSTVGTLGMQKDELELRKNRALMDNQILARQMNLLDSQNVMSNFNVLNSALHTRENAMNYYFNTGDFLGATAAWDVPLLVFSDFDSTESKVEHLMSVNKQFEDNYRASRLYNSLLSSYNLHNKQGSYQSSFLDSQIKNLSAEEDFYDSLSNILGVNSRYARPLSNLLKMLRVSVPSLPNFSIRNNYNSQFKDSYFEKFNNFNY